MVFLFSSPPPVPDRVLVPSLYLSRFVVFHPIPCGNMIDVLWRVSVPAWSNWSLTSIQKGRRPSQSFQWTMAVKAPSVLSYVKCQNLLQLWSQTIRHVALLFLQRRPSSRSRSSMLVPGFFIHISSVLRQRNILQWVLSLNSYQGKLFVQCNLLAEWPMEIDTWSLLLLNQVLSSAFLNRQI